MSSTGERTTTPDPAIGRGSEMSQAIINLVKPSISKLDDQVKNTRKSQILLAKNINQLSLHLKSIAEDQAMPYNLDEYICKLDDSRRRVTSVSQRLHALHERMTVLQRNIRRETFKNQ